MLNVKKIECNMLQENCYIVSDNTNQCVIIDCGAYYTEEQQAIITYIKENNLKPIHLLATHGHLDHNFGNGFIEDVFSLRPAIHEDDSNKLENLNQQAKDFFGMQTNLKEPKPEKILHDKDIISFGNHQLKVLHTPGHSAGSVAYLCEEEKIIFTGDTLFRHSIGRTDFKDGLMFAIIQSLRMLSQLPDDIKVYPGHGLSTTIGEEVAHNPYLDR